MTFAEQIKELNEIIAATVAEQSVNIQRLRECYELKINEQESDLSNALDDLENQTALTQTLKDKLEERKS